MSRRPFLQGTLRAARSITQFGNVKSTWMCPVCVVCGVPRDYKRILRVVLFHLTFAYGFETVFAIVCARSVKQMKNAGDV